MADGGDARTQPRRELHFEVEYSVLSGRGELRLIKASTLDFSLSGTRIETAETLSEGDRLSVRIEVPELADFRMGRVERKPFGTTVVMCFGQVRWISPSGEGRFEAGVRFLGLSVNNYAYLKRLLGVLPELAGGSGIA